MSDAPSQYDYIGPPHIVDIGGEQYIVVHHLSGFIERISAAHALKALHLLAMTAQGREAIRAALATGTAGRAGEAKGAE